jgi:hypothetical protein
VDLLKIMLTLSLIYSVGCATTHSLVAMKIDAQTAHINLGRNEVKQGDRLSGACPQHS